MSIFEFKMFLGGIGSWFVDRLRVSVVTIAFKLVTVFEERLWAVESKLFSVVERWFEHVDGSTVGVLVGARVARLTKHHALRIPVGLVAVVRVVVVVRLVVIVRLIVLIVLIPLVVVA